MAKDILTRCFELQQIDGEYRVDSRIIAKGLGQRSHTRFRNNILEKYSDSISSLGVLFKRTLPSGEIVWFLNEPQANFVGTLTRNNPDTVKFKLALVKKFEKAKKLLLALREQKVQRHNLEWQEARAQGKVEYKLKADVTAEFIQYAIAQGSKSADKYHMNLAKMENKALFLLGQKYPNVREMLDTQQLNTVQTADRMIKKALQDGMEQGLPYKEIYKLARERVERFAQDIGQTPVPSKAVTTSEQPARASH